MNAVNRSKLIKYLIMLIDIFTIVALAFQIHSNIVRVYLMIKSGVFLPYIDSFFISYDYYGFVGAITRSYGLIETYNHYGWSPDIYYRIAEMTMGTVAESLTRSLRFILFLANFWVIYKKKKNRDTLIKHPKTVIINIAFVITKIILYYWYFLTVMMG